MDQETNERNNLLEISILGEENSKIKKTKKVSLNKRWKAFKTTCLFTYRSLSIEKIFLFWTSIILGLVFLFLALNTISKTFLITTPLYGGTLSEGVIGVPVYINPVLASTLSEKDLVSLIFSGLVKKDGEGNLVNDLAESIEESEDGLIYTVKLKDKTFFHDGQKLTSDDIIFTLRKIQDKRINSPLALSFEGVEIEKIDDKTVIFYLKKPYYYFKEALTFGILPKHLLENKSADEFLTTSFNTKPIGSGPFKIESIVKNSDISEKYILISNKKYIDGRPYLDKIVINIYKNTQEIISAFNAGKIESTVALDFKDLEKINKKTSLVKNLPTIYFLSFNPNKNNTLASKEVRSFLAKAIDKQQIIDNILDGHANIKDFFFGYSTFTNDSELDEEELEELKENEFTLTTVDTGYLKEVAEKIANYWIEKGLNINILTYNVSDISEITKERDFEILLFGASSRHDTELYSHWHSSQRTYPGLNITGYVSTTLDENLENLRDSYIAEERDLILEEINKELIEEMPALPLYSQNASYILADKSLAEIVEEKTPVDLLDKNERFININEWYKYKEKNWSFSYNKKLIEKIENILHK